MRFSAVELDIPLAFDRSQKGNGEIDDDRPRFDTALLEDKLVDGLAENFGSGNVTATFAGILKPAIRRQIGELGAGAADGLAPERVRRFAKLMVREIEGLLKSGRLRMREGRRFDAGSIGEAITTITTEVAAAGPGKQLSEETEVVFEVSRLREYRPEDITRIRLVVDEDSMEWHQIEQSDGSVTHRLLPE